MNEEGREGVGKVSEWVRRVVGEVGQCVGE